MDLIYPLFWGIISFFIIQRLIELIVSQQNYKWLIGNGAKEYFPEHYKYMVIIHVLWFVSMLVEFNNFPPKEINLITCMIFLGVTLIGQAFRLIAICTLKKRWCTKILINDNWEPIKSGLYKLVKHPNYLGVVLEIAALPLAFGLYYTATIFTLLNFWILVIRIGKENLALELYYNKLTTNKYL
jgi:methyltransferase